MGGFAESLGFGLFHPEEGSAVEAPTSGNVCSALRNRGPALKSSNRSANDDGTRSRATHNASQRHSSRHVFVGPTQGTRSNRTRGSEAVSCVVLRDTIAARSSFKTGDCKIRESGRLKTHDLRFHRFRWILILSNDRNDRMTRASNRSVSASRDVESRERTRCVNIENL